MFRQALLAGCVALSLAVPASSSAQTSVINQVIAQTIGNMVAAETAARVEALCMSGHTDETEEKLAPIRDEAQAAMTAYVQLASKGARADTLHAFSKRLGKQQWFLQDVQGDAAAVDDSAARALAANNVALPAPAAFVRAGDTQSAAGQWMIADTIVPGGAQYTATFRKEWSTWRLTRVELTTGEATPLAQYCHNIGDVKPVATVAAAPASSAPETAPPTAMAPTEAKPSQ